MYSTLKATLTSELAELRQAGLYKMERIITSPQSRMITISTGTSVLNFCANNYLGLSNAPFVIEAAKQAMDRYGFGLSSVRFICGTQEVHKILEEKLTSYLGTEDTILYAAAFDANGGVFEPLFGEQDAIISDELNHASIIDGVRLAKAARLRYLHDDMNDLEDKLKSSSGKRHRIIVTDGAFSMDGTIAQLGIICQLAEKYDALVLSDESHCTGFLGKTGRGAHEFRGVLGKIDIITGTLGKALGGASGGFTSGRKEIIELLRQRSRPYLFSNTLAPSIAGATSVVLDYISADTSLRDKLEHNTMYFRNQMKAVGFDIKPGTHPIVPVMLYDAQLAQNFAAALLEEGIYVIGFFFPVVPKGKARIRVQISAAHTTDDLDRAVRSFSEVGKKLNVL